jgi:hypothetical protein
LLKVAILSKVLAGYCFITLLATKEDGVAIEENPAAKYLLQLTYGEVPGLLLL